MNSHSFCTSIKEYFIAFVFAIAAILFSSLASKAQTDTISATLISPTKFGGCMDTVFTLSYSNSGPAKHAHQLRITAALINSILVCEGDSSLGISLILIPDSNSINATYLTTSLTGDTLIYSVDTSTNDVLIKFKVHMDCSNANLTNGTDVSLLLKIEDVSNGYYFNVSGDNTSLVQVLALKILENNVSAPVLYFHTNDTSFIQFSYFNISLFDAHMRFSFNVYDPTLCGSGETKYFMYAIDTNPFIIFTPNTPTSIFLPQGKNLYIRQFATQKKCLPSSGCLDSVYLTYQCDYPESSFCTSCLDTNILRFDIRSNDNPSILMTDLLPTLIDSDYTCFNDSIERSYHFVYDPSTIGILDSVHIAIENYGQPAVLVFSTLSLIDKASVKIDCSSCNIETFISANNFALCTTYVSNPIRNFLGAVTNFLRGDTLTLKFKTYRCAEDNDTLLNKPKSLNQWQVWHTDFRICTDTGEVANVSSESTGANGGHNIDQVLEFFPTTNNISVPHDSLFGDTLQLTVDLKAITTNNYENFQYLGCNGIPGCQPDGLIRARVFVDTGLHISNYESAYFQVDTGILPNIAPYFIGANYYNSSIPDTVCEPGYYYFYYQLTDTLFSALRQGKFNYTVRACCADSGNSEPCKVGVSFYIMPDPNNCFAESFPIDNISPPVISNTNGVGAYIPLSSSNFQMHVHCPGCKAPGVIADSYKIKRISYGLQDSNNNSIADNGLTPITDTSAWYISNKKNLALNHSSFGDKLQDFLIAHFQDGDDQDTMMPGYKYSQMKKDSAFVRYLQIAAVIPEYKKHGLRPYSLDFYIDDTIHTGSGDTCIDCALFGTTTNHRTLLHVSIPNSLISNYLKIDTASGTYFTTFSMIDTSAFYVLDNTKLNILYQSLSLPFDSFEVEQRYRLTIKYDETNNFTTPPGSTTSDVTKPTEITLQTWLSGTPKPFYSFGMFTMPNTMAALHTKDWQFSNETDTFRFINQNFANEFQFYCEANGTMHYFFSQDVTIFSRFNNIGNCRLTMTTEIGSSIARNILNVYPYEYRPATLYPTSYGFKIPSGYAMDSVTFYNTSATETRLTTPTPIDSNGFFHIPYDSLPKPACRPENILANPYLQYLYSRGNTINLIVYLNPLSCRDSALASMDETVFATIDTLGLDVLHLTDFGLYDTLKNGKYESKAMSFANLQVSYFPSSMFAYTHNLCWQVTFTNPKVVHGYYTANGITTIGAPHVYLHLPDTSFFNHFTFTPDGSSIPIPAINGIINVTGSLGVDSTLTGTLCADYINCVNDPSIPIIAGYDCDNFPSIPFDTATACYTLYNSLPIENQEADLFAGIGPLQIDYSVCSPVVIPVSYSNSELGIVYPDSILFNNVQGVTVQKVEVKKCLGTATKTLVPTGVSNHWLITSAQLDSLDFYDGGVSFSQPYDSSNCIEFIFTLKFYCDFKESNLHNVIKFYGHDYCGDTIETPASLLNFIIDTAITCPDCYTITKTVDKDTAIVGEIVTYVITTCANNSSPQSIIISDDIPPNFTITSSTPSLPHFTALATGCITDTVRGFFTQAGSCPVTINVARLDTSSSGTAFTDTVCNTILNCFEPGMVFIADSTHITSSSTSYNNTTFFIQGTLFVDNNLTFTHCHIYVAAGGQILLNTTALLTLDSTIIEGCGYMWNGISLNANTGVLVQNSSSINDATKGVTAKKQSSVDVLNSSFINCVIGIYAPSNIDCNYNNTHFVVKGSKFGMNGNFKPDFIGQPAHGTRSKAGIEIFDLLNPTIGNNTSMKNQFYKMNTGIIAHRCSFTLTNNSFRNIDTVSFYNLSYNGAAIVSIGENCRAADLTITPEQSHDTTIYTCKRGVYTTYSNTSIDSISIFNVERGIYNDSCVGNSMFTRITHCNIKASLRGLDWRFNKGASSMIARNNTITMSGDIQGIVIKMIESNTSVTANYQVIENNIKLLEAKNGIDATSALRPVIINNTIYQYSGGTVFPSTNGIAVDGCDSTLVSCNVVTSNYPSNKSGCVGININLSNKSSILCNSTIHNYRGVYFGGVCGSTNFEGNSMDSNYVGLYLNKAAIIDQQPVGGTPPYHGNIWGDTTHYSSGYGAVNLNDNTFANLFASLFTTKLSVISHNPKIPLSATPGPFHVNNNGWFDPQNSGAYFTCSMDSNCGWDVGSMAYSMDLNAMIIQDKSITSDFIAESKMIAKQYLYDVLKTDEAMLASDSSYQTFKDEKETESIGYLYQTKNEFSKIGQMDSVLLQASTSRESLIQQYIDSIILIDSLALQNQVTNYNQQRNALLAALNTEQQTLNLNRQQQTISDSILIENAAIQNSNAIAQAIPDENEKFINEIEIVYNKQGINAIASFYEQVFTVANQCPYKGGAAVYRARAFVGLFNDTLEYDDENTCLQQGIYRQSNQTTINDIKAIQQIEIRPNPANDVADIILKGSFEGICNIELTDAIGRKVYNENFNCSVMRHSILTSKFTVGVYFIKIKINGAFFITAKMIIAR